MRWLPGLVRRWRTHEAHTTLGALTMALVMAASRSSTSLATPPQKKG